MARVISWASCSRGWFLGRRKTIHELHETSHPPAATYSGVGLGVGEGAGGIVSLLNRGSISSRMATS